VDKIIGPQPGEGRSKRTKSNEQRQLLLQPILQPNAAFIAPKLGEGRVKEGKAKTRNLNGGSTSRSKEKGTGDDRNGERQIERTAGRWSDEQSEKRKALSVRSNVLFAVHCSNIGLT
jgi:hypothetical protein